MKLKILLVKFCQENCGNFQRGLSSQTFVATYILNLPLGLLTLMAP